MTPSVQARHSRPSGCWKRSQKAVPDQPVGPRISTITYGPGTGQSVCGAGRRHRRDRQLHCRPRRMPLRQRAHPAMWQPKMCSICCRGWAIDYRRKPSGCGQYRSLDYTASWGRHKRFPRLHKRWATAPQGQPHHNNKRIKQDVLSPIILPRSNCPIPERHQLPEDVQKYFGKCDEKLGLIPNVFTGLQPKHGSV